MKKPVSRFALIALVLFWGGWIAFTAPSTATMPIQKKAKELGFPADNCLYCHNEKLPKKGAMTLQMIQFAFYTLALTSARPTRPPARGCPTKTR